jgi:hypothetical protein
MCQRIEEAYSLPPRFLRCSFAHPAPAGIADGPKAEREAVALRTEKHTTVSPHPVNGGLEIAAEFTVPLG